MLRLNPHQPNPIRTTPAPARLPRPRALTALACLLPLFVAGCQSTSSPLSQWRSALDSSLYKPLSPDEKASTSGPEDSTNLFQRWLTPSRSNANSPSPTAKPSSTLILGSDGWKPMVKPAKDPKADAELAAAVALFKQGKLPEAEKAFKQVAKDRKGTAWGEKSQFFLAECQYERKDYFHAHDSYEQLIVDYPGTEYLEKLVGREYAIAHLWLAQGDPSVKDDQKLPLQAHFTGELPIFDTDGSALKALEHVRQHDPTGKLADDASIQIADFHMTHRDFESAAIYYDQFIADHPKSPFLQRAQLAAIDARMNAYLGPEYDASGLEKARDLVKKTLQTFPERQASYEKLYQTLDHINDAEAEKTFTDALYYKKIKRVASAEFYFGKIPQRWPDSPWAKKAKIELAELAKMPRTRSQPVKIMTQPGSTDPFNGGGGMGGPGMGGMGGMNGMGMGGMGMGQGMM